jgi:glyoxylase-like metal-dependent hydrolase (beta-lactamase superfamily II)/rhodanese-related sulfurtransferase
MDSTATTEATIPTRKEGNVIFEQHYLDCLSQASYLIGDPTTGRAVVVDPKRDIADYLASAQQHDLRIELVIETHFHADFLSGHLELARATGAEIAYGSAAEAEFAHRKLADGERVSLGEVTLEILHTPGHTPESISIVVWEHPGDPDDPDAVPYGVLTGDTLFIGDVGRPDLLASIGVTADELGRALYDSLRRKLLPLPDGTKVFPGHGAGSACGKSLSTETVSTIGEQRRSNYALADMTVEQFLDVVTEGQPAAPGYFVHDAILNRKDRDVLAEGELPAPLGLDEVLAARQRGALLLDTRDQAAFSSGHVAGSLNVGLDGRFAEYAGSVARPDDELVLICDPGTELEARTRLARIGFDRVTGHLADPYAAMAEHPEVVERASRLSAEEFLTRRAELDDLVVVDVRNPGETSLGTIEGAHVVPVARLRDELHRLEEHKDVPVVALCAGGYRSSLAASLLQANGFTDVSDVLGGYTAVQAATAG